VRCSVSSTVAVTGAITTSAAGHVTDSDSAVADLTGTRAFAVPGAVTYSVSAYPRLSGVAVTALAGTPTAIVYFATVNVILEQPVVESVPDVNGIGVITSVTTLQPVAPPEPSDTTFNVTIVVKPSTRSS
jgi:hypothetical protein